MSKHSDETISTVFSLRYEKEKTIAAISDELGIARSSVHYILNAASNIEKFGELYDLVEPDREIISENVRLAKKTQRLMDSNRIANKSFREFARAENMLVSLHEELIQQVDKISKDVIVTESHQSYGTVVGAIQLSDLHFGECVYDLITNRFDFEVAAKRLKKLVSRAKTKFDSACVTDVVLMLTGDLVNSSRRISEITEYAAARTSVVVIAMDILRQVIMDLNRDYNVVVASVVGNESRVGEFFDTTDFLASDNYDLMLHNLLKRMFKDAEGVRFADVTNPLECVIDINGHNFLMVHGNSHRGIAVTKNIESEVEKIKARYSAMGVRIDYCVMGHIHQTYVSNWFSRSASLVGGNSYSERNLNLVSKAAQNVFMVYKDGIDATMIDLQNHDDYEPYDFDESLIRYFPSREQASTVVIQKVLV